MSDTPSYTEIGPYVASAAERACAAGSRSRHQQIVAAIRAGTRPWEEPDNTGDAPAGSFS
ncbi:MAG: hypothetical protein M0Z85_09425 [Gammaproteobacteria bacterium]|nr:hypothetical protein [Gammaproteobacteria bacterium]